DALGACLEAEARVPPEEHPEAARRLSAARAEAQLLAGEPAEALRLGDLTPPESARGWRVRAQAALRCGRPELALQAARAGLLLGPGPDQAPLRLLKSQALLELGRAEEALRSLPTEELPLECQLARSEA